MSVHGGVVMHAVWGCSAGDIPTGAACEAMHVSVSRSLMTMVRKQCQTA